MNLSFSRGCRYESFLPTNRIEPTNERVENLFNYWTKFGLYLHPRAHLDALELSVWRWKIPAYLMPDQDWLMWMKSTSLKYHNAMTGNSSRLFSGGKCSILFVVICVQNEARHWPLRNVTTAMIQYRLEARCSSSIDRCETHTHTQTENKKGTYLVSIHPNPIQHTH